MSSSSDDADRRVRHVAGVPAAVADAHVDEVDDVAEAEAVDEVADGAAEQQAQGERQRASALRAPWRHS